MKPARILLATGNPGKRREFQRLFGDLRINWILPEELGLKLSVAETGSTYQANASLKADAYLQASGLPTLSDDSGLEVEALAGAPGIRSARYAPGPASDADRRAYLLAQLTERPRPWRARFCCVIVLAAPGGHRLVGEGHCHGEIIPEERGRGGFGYDPIFLFPGLGRTMAELSPAEKDRISHRGRAARDIRAALVALLG